MKAATRGDGISRRQFLKRGARGGTALVVGFCWPLGAAAQQERPPVSPFNAWVRIGKDGIVTLICAKSELGQGVLTALPMILADELEVEWSRVRVEQAPTKPQVYDHGTGGSGSVLDSWLPLRRAGAAAREMLITAGAEVWGVSRETCRVEKGVVLHGPRTKRLTYGELVEAASNLPIPDLRTVPLKNPSEFNLIGKSLPRTDIPAKVDGSAVFGIDVRLPEMLTAVIARCPTFGGKVARFNAEKAKAVPGVRHVVEIPPLPRGANSAGGVAVVADNTWAAIRGRDALDIEWDHGSAVSESSAALLDQFKSLADKPGKAIRNEGDAETALARAAKRVEADYELPFLAHATMEPMNCTADARADRVEIWAPCQGPEWISSVAAGIARVPPSAVTVHTTLSGGGFGRRYHADFAVEAIQVSKAIGKPVKVVWTREDDMRHDFYRQANYHRLNAAFDEQGSVVAWMHRIVSTSIRTFWDPPDRARPEGQEVTGAADLPYQIPNLRVEYAPAATRVPRAWWRSVEHSFNAFAVECFLDELAVAANSDPLAFRLRLLEKPQKISNLMWPDAIPLDTQRLGNTLRLATEKASWGKSLARGRARGIAGHYSFNTYVAHVAEVSVERGGVPRVHRVVCAVDCGRAVNPDGVRAQMEGGIIFGLAAAFHGEITIKNGAVEQSNFHDYPMLRIDEAPEIEVHIVPSIERPTGTGEPGVPPIAPAVANALFAVTRKRARRLPFRAGGGS